MSLAGLIGSVPSPSVDFRDGLDGLAGGLVLAPPWHLVLSLPVFSTRNIRRALFWRLYRCCVPVPYWASCHGTGLLRGQHVAAAHAATPGSIWETVAPSPSAVCWR